MLLSIILLAILPDLVRGVNWVVPCNRFPGPCNHRCYGIFVAQQPSRVTWDGPTSAQKIARRSAVGALPNRCCTNGLARPNDCAHPDGGPRVPCSSPDEYPYAATSQGGAGGIIRCTGEQENIGEGREFGELLQLNVGDGGCGRVQPCNVDISFQFVTSESPFCNTGPNSVNDGFEWRKQNNAWVAARDPTELEPRWEPHTPDPAHFVPLHLRRELLLDNGERILLGSTDLKRDWSHEIFRVGNTTARVVRELHGHDKSPPFRPSNLTMLANATGSHWGRGVSLAG